MTISVHNPGERIINVQFDEHTVTANLADGRSIDHGAPRLVSAVATRNCGTTTKLGAIGRGLRSALA
jgi:hypothetical protein